MAGSPAFRKAVAGASGLLVLLTLSVAGQTPSQPRVSPGPDEPDWWTVLERAFGLRMYEDLENPVTTSTAEVPGLFRRARSGPVVYEPVFAFGTESLTRGGWYTAPVQAAPEKKELWSYQFKHRLERFDAATRVPLTTGSSTAFDPGDVRFGLWISNDGFSDGGVFSEPSVTAMVNQRLEEQPYKTMIYPCRDVSGSDQPHCYLIGWEYSTNDDFQDVVSRVENVILVK